MEDARNSTSDWIGSTWRTVREQPLAVFPPQDLDTLVWLVGICGSLGAGFRTSDGRVADIMTLSMGKRRQANVVLI